MWEPRRLTNLWASTACYRDICTFFLLHKLVIFLSQVLIGPAVRGFSCNHLRMWSKSIRLISPPGYMISSLKPVSDWFSVLLMGDWVVFCNKPRAPSMYLPNVFILTHSVLCNFWSWSTVEWPQSLPLLHRILKVLLSTEFPTKNPNLADEL
jgi:hypothetical protein